jgi:hypothetical protein
MVPQLHVVSEVEGHICDALIRQGAPHSEVAFTLVEPWHGVAYTIVLRELHLVRGGESIILFTIMAVAIWWLPIFLGVQGTLGVKEASIHELLLALLRDCHLDGGHMIVQGGQWPHHAFECLESSGDVRHGELLLSLLGHCPRAIAYR